MGTVGASSAGGDYSRNTVDADMGAILGPRSYYSTIYLGSNATDSGTGAGVIISSAGQPEDDPRRALNRYFGAVPDVGKDDTYIMSFDAQKRALDNIKRN